LIGSIIENKSIKLTTYGMIIYKITNKINNKLYIGQTIRTLKVRWMAHCVPSSKSVISRSIHKYGKENFSFEEIDRAETMDELNAKEEHWIKYYDSCNKEKGYNIALGGMNTPMDEETKKKLSIINSGKKKPPMTEEHRRNLSEAKKGTKHTKETKLKMSQAAKGKSKSEETKLKFSNAKKGKPLTKEHYSKILASRAKNRESKV